MNNKSSEAALYDNNIYTWIVFFEYPQILATIIRISTHKLFCSLFDYDIRSWLIESCQINLASLSQCLRTMVLAIVRFNNLPFNRFLQVQGPPCWASENVWYNNLPLCLSVQPQCIALMDDDRTHYSNLSAGVRSISLPASGSSAARRNSAFGACELRSVGDKLPNVVCWVYSNSWSNPILNILDDFTLTSGFLEGA